MRFLPLALLALSFTPLCLDAESLGNFKSTGFSYGYEKWSDLRATQRIDKDGTTILGPAAGGAGLYLNEGLDLGGVEAIEVSIKLAPGNSADALILKIPNVQEWRIDLAKLSADAFTTLRLPLSAEARAKKVEVKNVQVQGTFTPGSTVAVTFASISLVVSK